MFLRSRSRSFFFFAWIVLSLLSSTSTLRCQESQGSLYLDLRCVDIDGVVHHLGNGGEVRPFAVIFLDPACPIAKRYAPELARFSELAEELNVEIFAVISDPNTSLGEARQFRDDFKIFMPMIFDSLGDLAKRLKPTHVPECFVLNKMGQIVYRGRIDNRFYAIGKVRSSPTTQELRQALLAVAVDETPKVSRTSVVGCVFESWAEGLPVPLTYERHILPLLRANCTSCHQPKGSAPFSLASYGKAKRRARMSALVTKKRRMPPWFAAPNFGHFKGQRRLTSLQIAALQSWAKAGAPKGEEKVIFPPLPKLESNWELGEPDLVVTMEEPYTVPGTGDDIYRRFVVSNPFPEDVKIRAIDFHPGDPTVVHHSIVYADYVGWGRKQDAKDKEIGFDAFRGKKPELVLPFGGWAPGSTAENLPKGYATVLPGGCDLIIEIHYHLSGKEAKDQSSFAFYFAKEAIKHEIDGFVLGSELLHIKAGRKDHKEQVSLTLPATIRLLTIQPHMHFIGKSARAVAVLPDGKVLPLISVPDWDFRWQSIYSYRQPLYLPKGTRIDVEFVFDNSDDNPDNPHHPAQDINYGPQSTDEMMELYFTIVLDDKKQGEALRAAVAASWFDSFTSKKTDQKKKGAAPKFKSLLLPEESAKVEAMSDVQFLSLLDEARNLALKYLKSADLQSRYGILLAWMLPFAESEQEKTEIRKEAKAALKRALAIDPKHADARIGLGSLGD